MYLKVSYDEEFEDLIMYLKSKYSKELFDLDGIGEQTDMSKFSKRFFLLIQQQMQVLMLMQM